MEPSCNHVPSQVPHTTSVREFDLGVPSKKLQQPHSQHPLFRLVFCINFIVSSSPFGKAPSVAAFDFDADQWKPRSPGTNRDVIPDDLVSIFHKQSCNFGFVTHLFGTEIKALYSEETVGFSTFLKFGMSVFLCVQCSHFHLYCANALQC